MKRYKLILDAIAIVIAMASGAYAGTATYAVPVSATIVNKCVVGGSPAIAFGSLDPSAAGPYAGSVTDPALWCTMSVSVAVTNDGGQNYSGSFRLKSAAGDFIPYTITYTTPLIGAGKGIDIGGQGGGKLSMTASIPAGNIDNAPAGVYTDSVILTFTY